jgi:hypothetical protein
LGVDATELQMGGSCGKALGEICESLKSPGQPTLEGWWRELVRSHRGSIMFEEWRWTSRDDDKSSGRRWPLLFSPTAARGSALCRSPSSQRCHRSSRAGASGGCDTGGGASGRRGIGTGRCFHGSVVCGGNNHGVGGSPLHPWESLPEGRIWVSLL